MKRTTIFSVVPGIALGLLAGVAGSRWMASHGLGPDATAEALIPTPMGASRGFAPVTEDLAPALVIDSDLPLLPGDEVRIEGAGTFHYAGGYGREIVLAEGDVSAPVGTRVTLSGGREATVTGSKQLPAASPGGLAPKGTGAGDWMIGEVDGHRLWWRIRGVTHGGRRLVLNRPLEDPRTGLRFDGSIRVEFRGFGMVPEAMWLSTAIAVIAIGLAALNPCVSFSFLLAALVTFTIAG